MMAGNHHHSHYHLVRMNQALALKSPARGERGFLGFMGEPVMARGSAITLLAYAFHLLRQGPKPSVNVASHLVFGNAVAFLDFAF